MTVRDLRGVFLAENGSGNVPLHSTRDASPTFFPALHMTPTEYALMKKDTACFLSSLPSDMRTGLLDPMVGISIQCRRCGMKHWYSQGQYTYVEAKPAGGYCSWFHILCQDPLCGCGHIHSWGGGEEHLCEYLPASHCFPVYRPFRPALVRAKCPVWDTVLTTFAPASVKQ